MRRAQLQEKTGGGEGIRTPGTFRFNGFQERNSTTCEDRLSPVSVGRSTDLPIEPTTPISVNTVEIGSHCTNCTKTADLARKALISLNSGDTASLREVLALLLALHEADP